MIDLTSVFTRTKIMVFNILPRNRKTIGTTVSKISKFPTQSVEKKELKRKFSTGYSRFIYNGTA